MVRRRRLCCACSVEEEEEEEERRRRKRKERMKEEEDRAAPAKQESKSDFAALCNANLVLGREGGRSPKSLVRVSSQPTFSDGLL